MNAIVRLRIIQVGCILMVLGCIWVSRSGHHEWQGSLEPRHWLVMVAAIWGAISGFTLQRRLVGQPVNSRRPSRSTPFTRWRAGHIVRIWTAMTVGLGALLLSEFSGPPMMVNVLFALSLLLLLIWTPGPIPDQTKQA
jgi:hypothetical protein